MDAAVFSPFDELGAFEHAQMLRDGGKRHFIRGGEIADSGFPLREAREDTAARGVGKRGKSVIERRRLIVNHMVYYCAVADFCQAKSLELKRGEQVSELVFFRLKVGAGMFAGARAAGNPFNDANA